MRKQAYISKVDRGGSTSVVPPSGHPLDMLYEDHMLEREICALIDRLATSQSADQGAALLACHFLRCQLPAHMHSEEADLFPLLRARCEDEDEIDRALDRLESDHRAIEAALPGVVRVLDRVGLGAQSLSVAQCQGLLDYTATARRHLIFENAIVLPLARARLSEADLLSLSRRFVEHRRAARRREGCHAP